MLACCIMMGYTNSVDPEYICHCKMSLVILTTVTVLVISVPSMQDGDSCNDIMTSSLVFPLK